MFGETQYILLQYFLILRDSLLGTFLQILMMMNAEIGFRSGQKAYLRLQFQQQSDEDKKSWLVPTVNWLYLLDPSLRIRIRR